MGWQKMYDILNSARTRIFLRQCVCRFLHQLQLSFLSGEQNDCNTVSYLLEAFRVGTERSTKLTLPAMLEMSRKELCSCSFAAGWAPGNYWLEQFPTRNIKHEAMSLSTCSGLLIILTKGILFVNIVDKGYRCIVMAAWQAGKHLFLQPAFARSDRKVNTREVNRSSTVASDRSGNERAVNVAKRAGVLKRG